MQRLVLTVLGTFLFLFTHAQPASIQDCLGAIPICQQVYQGDQIPLGYGNVLDFESYSTCLPVESSSIWYTFSVNNSGQFGFLLTPNDDFEDYDWVLFDITNATCDDLYNNPDLVVSCNASGGSGCNGNTGATGGTNFNQQGPGCFNFPPTIDTGFDTFNDLINVQAGNTYALCISNFTVNSLGYTLDFGISTGIGIFDNTPPTLEEAYHPNDCNGQEIFVQFSEFVQCATLYASNFQLNGLGGPYAVTLSSTNCDAGGDYSKEFTLLVNPPVPIGAMMNLVLNVDGNTEALDLCDNPSEPVNLSFEGPSQSEFLELGSDTTLCASASILLQSNLQGTYLWSDGSSGNTLEVFEPGIYWLNINSTCGQTSDTIEILESSDLPLVNLGNDTTLCPSESLILNATTLDATYLWQDGSTNATFVVTNPGTYSVTISNACEVVTLSTDVLETAGSIPEVNLGNDTILCPGESLLLDLNTPDVSYLWQDGSTNSSFLVSQPGSYSVSLSNDCDEAQDQINIDFADPILVQLKEVSLCPGETASLDVSSTGASYLWQDGSTNATFVVTTPGTYSVTISNVCEVVTLSTDVLETAGSIPEINLGNDTILCPGESLLFDLNIPDVSYLWHDGTAVESYQITSSGNYSVTVANECGNQSGAIQITYLEPISILLLQDTVLCPGESLLLDVTDENASSYSWQDNSSESIYLVNEPGTYSVRASNQCEAVSASINIGACEVCNVFVPNAFSPNGDGRNDLFEPYLSCQIEQYTLKVFNRWGALLFASTSIDNGWNGTFKGQMVANDVYLYFLQFSVLENDNVRDVTLSGDITIVK